MRVHRGNREPSGPGRPGFAAALPLACVLSALVGAPVAPGDLRAQTDVTVQIDRIFDIEREREIGEPTARVQFGDADQIWYDARRRDAVPIGRRLRVDQLLDVRTRVTGRGSGEVVFLTELVARDGDMIIRGNPTPQAFFAVREPADAALGITVEDGSLVVDWTSGLLVIDVLTDRILVEGTKLAIDVDAVAGTATVFLLEGLVRLVQGGAGAAALLGPPGAPVTPMGPDQFATLARAQPLSVQTSPPAENVRLWRQVFEYNATNVWKRFRWYRSTPFRIGAGLVGGGALAYAIGQIISDGDDAVGGVVILSLPF